MNLSPDALDRALTELAERADLDESVDRVPAIHHRARRAATVRLASVAGALAAVAAVVAITLGAGGLPFTRADSVPAKPAPKPFLTVGLESQEELAAGLSDRGLGTPVVVQITFHGLVPQMYNDAGELATGTDNLLSLQMYWDPRGWDGRGSSEYHCVRGAPLVKMDNEFLMTTYAFRAGTHPITLRATACDPVGEVSEKLSLTVR
ncbi:MAG: hypothetical protein ABJA93_11880 [Sporichthyaceae bacterium]